MKKVGFIISILGCSVICFSQDQLRIDSLYAMYESSEIEVERIEANQLLVTELYYTDRQRSKELFDKEHKNIIESEYLLPRIISYQQASLFSAGTYDYERALALNDSSRLLLNSGRSVLSKNDYQKWMIESYFWDGSYYYRYSDIVKSNESFILALEHLEGFKDKSRYIKILTSMGINYYTTSNYIKANQKFKEALSIANTSDDIRTTNMLHEHIGFNYTARELFDSAEYHLQRSVEMSRSREDHVILLESLLGLAEVYEYKNMIDSAILMIETSIVETKGLDYALGQSQQYLLLGRLQIEKKEFVNARLNLEKFSKLNRVIGSPFLREQYLRSLANLENREQNYSEAYALLLEGSALHDSLSSQDHKKLVESIEAKYETAKKDVEIARQETVINRHAKLRGFYIGGGVFSIFLAGFFWYRKKVSNQLSNQEKKITNQKIDQLEKEKKILSMNAMIEGQEAERSRIARDLHDGLGGLLSTVKAHFSNIQSEIQKIEKMNVYNRANELVDEACDEVRRISHNLMPGALRLEGLKTAVEHLGEEMSAAHPFTVRVESRGFTTRMEETKEVFIYRIIQEALNNIIKHAEATDVLVQLSETDEEYHFIIEDDGCGFDPLQIESGLGLKSLQSRVDFLKGSLDVDTKQDVGTTLSWHIPK